MAEGGQRRDVLRALVPVIVAAVTEAFDTEDEEKVVLVPAVPRCLPKSRVYFTMVNEMDDTEFHSHFRLGRGTF